MARRFGTVDLNDPKPEDAVFFVAAGELIHYSAWLAIPLAIFVPILVLSMIWIGIRDGRFSIAGIAAGFAIYVIAVAVSVVEARGVWWLMSGARGLANAASRHYLRRLLLLARGRRADLRHAVGSVRADQPNDSCAKSRCGRARGLDSYDARDQHWMPGASYIFAWPLLFAALAIGYPARATDDRPTIRPRDSPPLVALAPAIDARAIIRLRAPTARWSSSCLEV